MTQNDLADASGIEQSRISKYEQDKQRPGGRAMLAVAKGLQWELAELLAGVDLASFTRRDLTRHPKALQSASSQGGAVVAATSGSFGGKVGEAPTLEAVLDVAARLIEIGIELQQLSQSLAAGQDGGTRAPATGGDASAGGASRQAAVKRTQKGRG